MCAQSKTFVVLFKRFTKTVWLTRRWELVLATLWFWMSLTTSAALVQSPELQTFLLLLLLLLSGSSHLLFAPFKNPSTNVVASLSSVTLSLMVFIGLAFGKLPSWFAAAIEVLVLLSTTGVLVRTNACRNDPIPHKRLRVFQIGAVCYLVFEALLLRKLKKAKHVLIARYAVEEERDFSRMIDLRHAPRAGQR